jgi:hypothetical protein
MLFRNLILSLMALQSTVTTVNADGPKKMNYIFDQDAAAAECERVQRENDEETFRLFCVNRKQSFKLCSVSCSDALYFEGTIGECQPHRCSFFGQQFVGEDGKTLSMSKIAQGKVTIFGIVPLWEAQAQYFYELGEFVKSLEPDDTEVVIMPLYVEDKEPVKITPIDDGKVHILQTAQQEALRSHPILMFLQSLTHKSGYANFDFYMDRPTFFAVNHDGSIVERMVTPTKDTLMDAIEKYSKGYKGGVPKPKRVVSSEM